MTENTSVDKIVATAVSHAVAELYGVNTPAADIAVTPTRKEFEGNLTVVVFPWVKAARCAPEAVGQAIGTWLTEHEPAVEKFNVVKGFLNITLRRSVWCRVLQNMAGKKDFGLTPVTEDSPLIMVEYSSPNTNKPLHLGHVRNNLLGYSLARILSACGNRVVKTNIVNDRGIHICKSMLAWKKWHNGETPESTGIKGDHLIGDCYVDFDKHYKAELSAIKAQHPELTDEEAESRSQLMQEAREMLRLWEAKDPEVRALWEMMNHWVYDGFDATYRRMGVDFDKIYYESDTYLEGKEKVLEGLEKGIMYRREDGSVWADLTDAGLDHKLLLRSDGTSVYMTQDIGTAKLRFKDYPIDRMIYVVGNEQNYHFQVLSLLLDRLGFSWGKDLVHFSYGMVNLPSGRMKSREGTVVDADDLMEKMVQEAAEVARNAGKTEGMTDSEIAAIAEIVGLGALKYFLLKVDPRKNIVFNPSETIDFNGNTGPFIQYTYSRIRSVLRRAEEAGYTIEDYSTVTPNDKEVAMIQRLASFPATVAEAGRTYSPALIANYLYDLAKEYNGFYHDCSILREEDTRVRSLRLQLSATTAAVINTAMSLLGINVPERM